MLRANSPCTAAEEEEMREAGAREGCEATRGVGGVLARNNIARAASSYQSACTSYQSSYVTPHLTYEASLGHAPHTSVMRPEVRDRTCFPPLMGAVTCYGFS
jgi:hypothetical protein